MNACYWLGFWAAMAAVWRGVFEIIHGRKLRGDPGIARTLATELLGGVRSWLRG